MYNSNIVIHEESRTESLGVTTLNVFCGQSVRFALNRHLKWGIREAEQQGSTDTERIVLPRKTLFFTIQGKNAKQLPQHNCAGKTQHLPSPEDTSKQQVPMLLGLWGGGGQQSLTHLLCVEIIGFGPLQNPETCDLPVKILREEQ
ncbi:hypothetical protein T06_847 [Trichinella sp. T6]|nr:hypothetical protein T06_847 [Trichinella sp. T6]